VVALASRNREGVTAAVLAAISGLPKSIYRLEEKRSKFPFKIRQERISFYGDADA
jgi:hypothetical protein